MSANQDTSEVSALASRLPQPYLIALNIPIYVHDGKRYADELWLQDLERHLDYIERVQLFCPVIYGPPPERARRLPERTPFDRLDLVPALPAKSMVEGLLTAPANILKAWRAVKVAQIVHGGAIGWPIPLGYYTALAAYLQGKFHISVMESSPWRLLPDSHPALVARVRAFLMERMASVIARSSHLALFTTAAYLESMVPEGAPYAHVFKASWIVAANVVSERENQERWTTRLTRPSPHLRIGFAARLTREKGVSALLDALGLLDPRFQFEVFIAGEGDCTDLVLKAAERLPRHVDLKVLGRLEYGAPFFAAMDQWDVTVVPSLSDEQPRIVYDSFARGIPVVCSSTRGMAECVQEGHNGYLVPPGDAQLLSQCLNELASNRERLREMSTAARASALSITHERMHSDRRALIESAWHGFAAHS